MTVTKTIIICDGLSHSRVEYRLHGSTLEMTQPHVCDYLGRKASMGSHKLQNILAVLGLSLTPEESRQ